MRISCDRARDLESFRGDLIGCYSSIWFVQILINGRDKCVERRSRRDLEKLEPTRLL